MFDATALALPNEEVDSAALLQTLLDASLTGIVFFRPVYDAAGQQLIDLNYEYLNPAAQQLLGLPERPSVSLLARFPAAAELGILALYGEALLTGQRVQHQLHYQRDGLDDYFQVAALRQGPRLVVSFADTDAQPRRLADKALQAKQAREQVARAEAERVRADLTRAFEQAQVAFALFRGPELIVEFANPEVGLMLGRPVASILGRPVFEAIPDMRGQGLEELMGSTFAQGTPHDLLEVPVRFDRAKQGRSAQGYFNITYRPQHDSQGNRIGVVCVGIEVTAQVLARQQVEEKERQTSFLNEQLHAANLEILANNTELEHAQQQLRQLNEELEMRVAERTSQLEEQQSLLGQVLSQVPAYIATFSGPAHRYSFFNAQYQQLAAGRATLGKSMLDAMPETAEQGFGAVLDQVYASGKPYVGQEIAVLLEQPAGPPRQHYFNLTYQPLTNRQHQVQGILSFAVEVTEQVLTRRQADTMQAAMLAVAQRRAHERQELFQIFAQTPVAIVLLREPDHRIDYYNPAFEALFPPEEWHGGPLRGHSIGEVYPRIRAAGLVALLDVVFQTGESQAVLDMPLANLQPGSPRYVTFAYQAYREEGRIVGVAAFVYDTTEQVLGRQQREQQQQELRRIFEQAPVAITVMRGPELRVELANEAICAIWGRPASQVVGRPYFEAVPETAGQGFEELLAGVLQTGEPFFINEAPVTLDRVHTGRPSLGYFNFVFQPLRNERHQPVGLVAIGTEVTDQVLARQQILGLNDTLQATNARLLRTNADLDTFVYSASHDLKSPITNIEGLLLALRQQLPPEAQQAELVPQLLKMMDGAVQRFQQTLGHLTDVSRLQLLAADQTPEVVDLPALVEAVRLDILPELSAAGATLVADVAQCPTLYYSPKNLRSILYNLLSNAVKYRAPDRPPLVQLRCRAGAAGQVVLEVQDNGLGLSESQQGELFRLFRRLHSHVSGSGVGLYMVKKMVDNAGGSLTVQSQPGVGSTFTIALPVLGPAPA